MKQVEISEVEISEAEIVEAEISGKVISYTFTTPPEWLVARTDYSPWSKGKPKLWQEVERFYNEAAPEVNDGSAIEPLTEEDRLALRLFACWLYHWEKAGTGRTARRWHVL